MKYFGIVLVACGAPAAHPAQDPGPALAAPAQIAQPAPPAPPAPPAIHELVSRDSGTCPPHGASKVPLVQVRNCEKADYVFEPSGRYARPEPPSDPVHGPPAPQVVRTADEFRRAMRCEPPAGFDFTREQIAIVVITDWSNAPQSITELTPTGFRISTGYRCQGMAPRQSTYVAMVALPASIANVEVETCMDPRPNRPCMAP